MITLWVPELRTLQESWHSAPNTSHEDTKAQEVICLPQGGQQGSAMKGLVCVVWVEGFGVT